VHYSRIVSHYNVSSNLLSAFWLHDHASDLVLTPDLVGYSSFQVILPDTLRSYVEPDIQVLAAFALNGSDEVGPPSAFVFATFVLQFRHLIRHILFLCALRVVV
jgi:hypothetical protein